MQNILLELNGDILNHIHILYYRAEKDKSKFQQELFELMSQIEVANKDRVRLIFYKLMIQNY